MKRIAVLLVFVVLVSAMATGCYQLEIEHGAKPRQALIVSATAGYIAGYVLALLATAFQNRARPSPE